jgi:hypothetical protein
VFQLQQLPDGDDDDAVSSCLFDEKDARAASNSLSTRFRPCPIKARWSSHSTASVA